MEFSTKRQFIYLRLCEMDHKEYQLSLSKSDTGEVASGDPINILIYIMILKIHLAVQYNMSRGRNTFFILKWTLPATTAGTSVSIMRWV